MLPTSDSNKPVTISALFSHIEEILLRTWCETGHGQLTIESQRIRQDKIRVTLRGSTHYVYFINDDAVKTLIAALKPKAEQQSD